MYPMCIILCISLVVVYPIPHVSRQGLREFSNHSLLRTALNSNKKRPFILFSCQGILISTSGRTDQLIALGTEKREPIGSSVSKMISSHPRFYLGLLKRKNYQVPK
ncbi:hypothetical protein F5Y11DRAFT_317744 [Daldinia sp. FL1419]|nr:hypothetical protein F5Y11DRAFT_317744 [Daldinia sp. FL1419]